MATIDLYQMQRFAAEAQACHEDPAFRRAFDKMYRDAMNDIRNSQPDEQGKREAAYWRLTTLDAMDQALVLEAKAPDLAVQRQQRLER